MALKDTLGGLKTAAQKQAEFEASIPKIVEEWVFCVDALLSELRTYIEEYVNDGSIKTKRFNIPAEEEMLGDYVTQELRIFAGNTEIVVKPIARMVMGFTGAVGMTRQGSSKEAVINRTSQDSDRPAQWIVRKITRQVGLGSGLPELSPLTKESFEDALDHLLKG